MRSVVRHSLSSSWKLPPRGARRARPGGGERRGRTRPSVPGEGSAPPPSSRWGGEERRERRRGREGARKRERRLPAPPPAWRTTGSRCCPLPPTAPADPRHSRATSRGSGAVAAGAVGTGAETFKSGPVFYQKTSSYFGEARWADLVPVGVGHISLQPGDVPSTLKQRGINLGEAVR